MLLVGPFLWLFLLLGCEAQLPPNFVIVADVIPSLLLEMRYATMHNFVGAPVMGYDGPHCVLTIPAAKALARVQEALLTQNMSLKVYDCYRPTMAVDQFMMWSSNPDTLMKSEFYPDLTKDVLFPDGYIAANSTHSRGSTVDITVVPLKNGKPLNPQGNYTRGDTLYPCYAAYGVRFPDNSLDMGTGFDCFNELAYTNATDIPDIAFTNRMILQGAMIAQGFASYPEEWWHFTLNNEPFPHTYFNFPIPA